MIFSESTFPPPLEKNSPLHSLPHLFAYFLTVFPAIRETPQVRNFGFFDLSIAVTSVPGTE
jgi:hypothetical protein